MIYSLFSKMWQKSSINGKNKKIYKIYYMGLDK
jgi:hypothetical protein